MQRCRCTTLALVAIACTLPAAAFNRTVELGDGVSLAVYAPDWIWQQREANVLFVVRNGGRDAAEVRVALRVPPGLEDHFDWTGPAEARVVAPSGGTGRGAFTGLLAKDGVPCQTYGFEVTAEAVGETRTLGWPLKTVRGAVVGTSAAAIALPVVIALGFTAVFALALGTMAARRAWRTIGPPVTQAADRPGWIDEGPA